MLNSCLSLFTNMRSKSEGQLLGQGFWSNLFYYLHINYAIAVLSFYCAWLIVFVFQKVGRNVLGVKCPGGEMSSGWNVFGVKCTGVKCPGVKCVRGEMSWYLFSNFIFWLKWKNLESENWRKKIIQKNEMNQELKLTPVTIARQNESEKFNIQWKFLTLEHFEMILSHYFHKVFLLLNSSLLLSAGR